MVRRDSKVGNFANSLFFFFLLIIIRSGLLGESRWSVCMSMSHRSLCVSFSRKGAGLYIYHLFVLSNLNFLHFSLWITLPTKSYLVLYSFCANFLHSLIMWLIVSSLSPHSLHLLFCWVLSILALIWLVMSLLLGEIPFLLLLLLYSIGRFLHQRSLKVFHWVLSYSKSPQVSMTPLSILANLSNAVQLYVTLCR